MSNPTYGIIVIGDEILSGRRKDRHLDKTIELLAVRGEQLSWARYISDNEADITETLKESMNSAARVFCFGGIGATPDDMTRQSAARAANQTLQRHPQATKLIEQQFGEKAYPMRILMADLPEACELIPNPYNQIPGFSINHHHFLPGFPVMAHPMMAWVLDNRYPLSEAYDYRDAIIYLHKVAESSLIEPMRQLMDEHPDVSFFSLPIHTSDSGISRIEFGAKGPAKSVGHALIEMQKMCDREGFDWSRD